MASTSNKPTASKDKPVRKAPPAPFDRIMNQLKRETFSNKLTKEQLEKIAERCNALTNFVE